MNLFSNAVDSIEREGEITIRTERDGEEVIVSVIDTGEGIPPENLDRIFDPGFTTRGVGVGLGLSTVYRIVQKHGGRIDVKSRVNEGSTFTIQIPIVAQGADE